MSKPPVKPLPANPNAPPQIKPVSKGMKARSIALCVILAILAVRMIPTTMIVVVGMLPTAVAYFVDNSREKSLGPVVLWLNFAGVLPALFKLWQQGHTVNNALDIITEPMILAVMLFPAAIGWMLYSYVPYLVVGIFRRKAEMRIKSLEKAQADLIEQWGEHVGGQVKHETDSSNASASLTA